jgi:putative ABC transport system permease protein
VIVLVIAVSSCIGLSIRQAADSAKEETLSSMSVTATISFDRSSAMNQMAGEGGKDFDRSSFQDMMNDSSSLTLEEYETYATASSVSDFYYTMTSYVNGTDDFEPVSNQMSENSDSTSTDTASTDNGSGNMPGMGGDSQMGMGGGQDRIFGASSDFTIIAYSSESAMTSFQNGTASMSDGTVFDMDEANNECIITEELATYNDLSVGDTIQVSNPNNEDELYTLTIVGIYADSSANQNSFSMFGATSGDQANQISVNYPTLQAILDESAEANASDDSEDSETAITGTLSGTYVFADVDAYESFEDEAKALGLSDDYVISSSDISSFESSMVPLDTLSTMAGYFLIVILIIGAIILVVLNIFNIRERKYEIGVLTAMGMKKWKVALQFLTEIFVVTLASIIIGAGIGAVSSVPVTNALLENQVASQSTKSQEIEQNFGRGDMNQSPGGDGTDTSANGDSQAASSGQDDGKGKGGMGNFFGNMFGGENAYVTEVSSAMNFTVVLQMLGIGILLTLISGMVSMLFVMRYEPLKILANRD